MKLQRIQNAPNEKSQIRNSFLRSASNYRKRENLQSNLDNASANSFRIEMCKLATKLSTKKASGCEIDLKISIPEVSIQNKSNPMLVSKSFDTGEFVCNYDDKCLREKRTSNSRFVSLDIPKHTFGNTSESPSDRQIENY